MIRAKVSKLNPMQQLFASQKLAHAAIEAYRRAFITAYPVGMPIAWMRGRHMQHGKVICNDQPHGQFGEIDPTLTAINGETDNRVRVRLSSIQRVQVK